MKIKSLTVLKLIGTAVFLTFLCVSLVILGLLNLSDSFFTFGIGGKYYCFVEPSSSERVLYRTLEVFFDNSLRITDYFSKEGLPLDQPESKNMFWRLSLNSNVPEDTTLHHTDIQFVVLISESQGSNEQFYYDHDNGYLFYKYRLSQFNNAQLYFSKEL